MINYEALTAKETFPVLPEEKVSKFRGQFKKRDKCHCGHKGIHKEPIQGYFPHKGGWEIDGAYWWLFVVCPKCDYAWTLWKLGVKRER